ncbi:unnamed protein product [Arctogadus glacialis]
MDTTSNFSLPTLLSTPGNFSHHTTPPGSQRWEFLVAVLATAVSVSVLLAVLAKCQVIRRYLASYRHTRLRDGDSVSQGDPSGHDVEFSMHGDRRGNPHCMAPIHEEDDDGFIEDNYIQSSEREKAERALGGFEDNSAVQFSSVFGQPGDIEDEDDQMDEIQFSIA